MDFSGASLRLKAEGEDKVLGVLDRIDKKAQQSIGGIGLLTQREVDKAAAAFDQLYGKQSKAARQTQAVLDDVVKKVDASVGGMSHSAALGLGELARGFGRVAETGNVSAFAVREFTGAAFRLGGALGATGLGAGIGIAAIAIGGLVEYMEGARKKADELAAHYQQALERIAHASSLFQASQEQQFAFSGDPLAAGGGMRKDESFEKFVARSKGLQGLAVETDRLNTKLAELNKLTLNGTTATTDQQLVRNHLIDQLKEVKELQAQLNQEYALAHQRVVALTQVESDRARIALDKLDARQKHVPEFDTTDPYRREANQGFNLKPDALTQEFARLEAQIPDPLKEIGDKLKANQAADYFQITSVLDAQLKGIGKQFEQQARDIQEKAQELGSAIANGITDGLRAAFSKGGGLGAGFKAMTEGILDGLGEMFARIAEKALIGSEIMQKLALALHDFNPWLAAAAAAALFAYGSSLRSSGSSSGSAGGGTSYGSSLPSINSGGIITAATPQGPVTNPSSIQTRQSVTNYNFIVGKDPKAWREVQRQLDENAKRA